MRVLLAALLAAGALLISGCGGCPEGQHRFHWTVNNVTNSMCVND